MDTRIDFYPTHTHEGYKLRQGRPFPFGATLVPGGVNFSIFSKNSTAVELLLFDEVDAHRPAKVIALNASEQRTFHYWHVFVPGLKAGQFYGYRAHGPYEPQQGYRFDPAKVLLDP